MGKVYVCGDTHGKHDIKKVYNWYNKNVENLTEEDVLIQLGDWGAIWHDKTNVHAYKKDVELQVKWAKKKFTLCVVPGNHENYDIIDKLPKKEKFGGIVRVLQPRNVYNGKLYKEIFLLERGEIYNINGKTFLCVGGASSQDKYMRTVGVDWWSRELLSKMEEDNCLENLDKVNWKVDYVISHTCPTSIGNVFLERIIPRFSDLDYNSKKAKSNDPVSKFLQHLLDNGLEFKEWHFGHWHEDIILKEKFFCHYNVEPKELSVD